jgi:hypothetical protein
MYVVGQQRSLGKAGKPTAPEGDAPELPPLPQGNVPPAADPATQ